MSERPILTGSIRPLDTQPPLPLDRLVLREAPEEEAIPLDVAIVGAGPAGLATAIELARLAKRDAENGGDLGQLEIGVLEKAGGLGEHNLSGAVVNPRAFKELFPDVPTQELPFRRPVTEESVYMLSQSGSQRLPTPPTMKNHGNWIASICEVVRWMGDRAEELGVNVFPGFPADALLVEGDRVQGVRTTPSGLDREGNPGSGYEPAGDILGKVTVLADGTRSALAQAYNAWQGIGARNPQIYALGVKELWQVQRPLDRIIHTLGWPLPKDAFGGSFIYPLADDLIALGLVVGLDYHNARLDVHGMVQQLKGHPLLRPHLEGGEMVEWGAKTIPEGGYYSVAERRHGDGIVIVGDAAGYVDVPSLKGIHYAVHSGILAARTIFRALKDDDTSEAGLRPYTEAVDRSYIMADLKRTRNMRLAFKGGFYSGGVKAGLMTISGGALFGGHISAEEDAAEPKHLTGDGQGPGSDATADGTLTFSKVDAVYKSGNQTRDDIPSHLEAAEDVPPEVAEMYVYMCPAGVYERAGDELRINAPNCVDCKATDVIGPRWAPREGGSGPAYRRM